MKILVVSDTHRFNFFLEKVIDNVGKIDMVIHCGDAEGSEELLRDKFYTSAVVVVAGNNDYFSKLPKEACFDIEGRKVFVTHGHNYQVNTGIDYLLSAAKTRGADIVMFGHTHIPMMEKRDGIVVLNPGSISSPRQADKRPSYMIIETDNAGNMRYTLNYVKR